MRASTHTPRLSNVTVKYSPDVDFDVIWNASMPFTCFASANKDRSNYLRSLHDQWRTSLCQLSKGGGRTSMYSDDLICEFRDNLTYTWS